MTMHMLGPAYNTTGKSKSKQKYKSAAQAAQARRNAENWQRLLEKYDVKPQSRNTKTTRKHSNVSVYRRESNISDIPSLDSGLGCAPKRESSKYTGDAMIGIGQLHKSNAVPVFKQEDAEAISKMRRN